MDKYIVKLRQKIISIFDKYVKDDYLLFVFGSFAKDIADRTSDIDLAIYSKNTLPISLIGKIREELEVNVSTLRSIDVVNLTQKNINNTLLENILKEGLLWKKGRNSGELLKNLRKHLENSKK